MEPAHFNLILGWTSVVAGAISGATLGLFFHDERWMGGYASFRRRLMRLGHIAFFGLGILNVLFALSVTALSVPRPYDRVASAGFAVGAVTMPVCCFLTAWRGGFRYLFPIPVLAVRSRRSRRSARRVASRIRLGLLAMSGVRAYDPELTALGLTLPGFVERNHVIASLPSLGLLTLAGATPDEIELEYVDVPKVHPAPWLPGEFDAVAVSSFSAQMKEAYELADRYRAAGAKVVLGGLHVTAVPHEAAAHADGIVLGEGEPLWPRVVDDLRHGVLQPVYDARRIHFDLALAPMPRYQLLDVEKYNRLTVQTQRGCPFNCEFCAASIRIAPGFKTKPVDIVIAEVRRIKSLWSKPFIELADDNTFANKEHGRRLLRALVGEHVRWFTETDDPLQPMRNCCR